jgi:hypothetical protein
VESRLNPVRFDPEKIEELRTWAAHSGEAMKSISLPWFCFVWGGGFGAAVPPPLVGKEDRHENDGCGDAEADSEASLIGAEQSVGKQCHAGAGNNAIDEGDHRGGRREKRDERPGPEPQYAGACHGAVTKGSAQL